MAYKIQGDVEVGRNLKIGGSTTSGYVFTTDANGNGTWQVASGGGGTPSGAAGSVQFSNGTAFASDNAKFFWDNASKYLGLGNNSPTVALDVTGALKTSLDATINTLTVGLGGGSVSSNTVFGVGALALNTTGTYHVAVGRTALATTSGSTGCTAVGNAALTLYTGNNSTAVGNNALSLASGGSTNTGVGAYVLSGMTSGSYNTALGANALHDLTTQTNCIAIGHRAGYFNTSSNRLFIDGVERADATAMEAGAIITGTFSATPANQLLKINAALTTSLDATINTVKIGLGGGSVSTNLAIGAGALAANTTGAANVAIGANSLPSVTTSSANTALGEFALHAMTGAHSLGLGFAAGYNSTIDNSLFIDSYYRIDAAAELAGSIITGIMDALPANQTLTLNAKTTVSNTLKATGLIAPSLTSTVVNGNMFITPNGYGNLLIGASTLATYASSTNSAAVGGINNTLANCGSSFIGGGYNNTINTNDYSALVGGNGNIINPGAYYSFIGGGNTNNINSNSAYSAIIAGKNCEVAGAVSGAVAMGFGASVSSNNSLAIGNNPSAVGPGAVWNGFYYDGATANLTLGRYVDQSSVSGNTNTLKFQTINGSNQSKYIGLRAPSTLTASTTFVLPAADGTTGQVLKTDGSANLGWVTPASGGTALSTTTNVTNFNGLLSSADTDVQKALDTLDDAFNGHSGGTTLVGGTGATQNLVLTSTSHATKGRVYLGAVTTYATFLDEATGNMGILIPTTPTAQLHLGGGGSAAGSACLKMTSNALLSTPEAGAWEFKNDDLYFTITTGAARKAIPFIDNISLKTKRIPFGGTQGFMDDGNLQYNQTTRALDARRVAVGQFIESMSYGNMISSGARSALSYVTVTASAGLMSGTPGNMADGVVSTVQTEYFNGGAVGPTTYMRFDFGSGSSQVVTEAKWYQQGSQTHGVWQWQGSNDASTWTNIGATFTWGGATISTQTTLSGNTTGYRYYQIVGVSGNTSGAPYIYEMEFKSQNALPPPVFPNSYFSAFDIIPSYIETVIKNGSNGATASADVMASNDFGTETTYFIDMGMNSSGWSDPTWTVCGANDGYLYTTGLLAIGTTTVGKDVVLFTGGTLAANVRLRVDGTTGNVGVGTESAAASSTLDVLGTARFGDHATNYTDFETDGTLHMTGAATVWNDVFMSGLATRVGSSAPTFAAFSGGVYGHRFDDGATAMEVHGSLEMQHDYKEGTALSVHVHWSPTTTNTGNIRWGLEYSIANIGSAFPTTSTIYVTQAGSGVVNQHQLIAFADISGTGRKLGDVLAFRLFRDSNNAADTFTGNAFLHQIGIHYECDTLGSRVINAK